MQQPSLGDYPIIIPLDPIESTATQSRSAKQPELDLQSTLGTGSLAVLSSWIQECATSHTKCPRVFKGNPGWFPDRLVHITCTESSVTTAIGYPKVDLAARIVLRSNPADFSPDKTAAGIIYISLSHCWGPPPDPSAPLGGRADSVLTTSKLSNWLTDIPIKDLPLTFQHAIIVCAQLGCDYLWIDSLCIVQDSLEDWQTQSAVMGDIYKFAFLNIAILSTTSDYEGFINPARDTRIDFGFRASFASLLGRSREEKNSSGQECVLLRGSAKLLWSFQSALPMSSASNAPLCNRAWVYQERCLARRTLAFAANSMYWACDEGSRGEQPEWAVAGLESTGLRRLLHSSHEIAETARAQGQTRLSLEQHWAVFSAFDMHWHSCVTSYSQCKLTKLTDKLVAISAVARELHSTLNLGDLRYLAGLWEINLPSQLAWITVKGRTTSARARVGDREYVAPSWSWASIDAPVQPRLICRSGGGFVALAVARAAEVALDTENTFGSVKAGWLRLRGCLNHVRATDLYEPADLVDKVTGEELGFCSDTVEGYEMMGSESDLRKIVWVPLTLQFAGGILRCTYLVLIEDEMHGGGAFVKTGEKVYRRIGWGDFGRRLSLFRADKLLMDLGTFPDIEALDGQGEALVQGFKKREDTLEEFVLI
ncbi:MAG: hypothetical protein Q9202_006367 [Teloschistes flavicans]